MKAERLKSNPIIRPDMDGAMGANINGPSLIRVPGWLPDPLGRYYLYFAHHKGDYIRVAYADDLEGPWRTHEPGTLRLEDAYCLDHIASPDVHVDDGRREIRMYYHGIVPEGGQRSKVALSEDGISFVALPESLGRPYFRVIRWDDLYYALGMPGVFYRSADGLSGFEQGPACFTENMRHSALRLRGSRLQVFYSNAGHAPERIVMSTIGLDGDWANWKATEPTVLLEPGTDYEGADLPVEPSARGIIEPRVRQLRDPAIFEEDGETYLLYSVAGEHGIAIARLAE